MKTPCLIIMLFVFLSGCATDKLNYQAGVVWDTNGPIRIEGPNLLAHLVDAEGRYCANCRQNALKSNELISLWPRIEDSLALLRPSYGTCHDVIYAQIHSNEEVKTRWPEIEESKPVLLLSNGVSHEVVNNRIKFIEPTSLWVEVGTYSQVFVLIVSCMNVEVAAYANIYR